MAATSGKQRAVGLRYVSAFVLDASGFPAGASGTTLFTGLNFEGGRAFNINTPDPITISHDDNDFVQQVDFLPSKEGVTGELRVGIDNQDVNAALTDVEKYEVAEMTFIDWQTSKQGNEPDVGLFLFQQSLDTASSSRRWRSFLADKTKVIPKASNFDENKSESVYNVAISPAAAHLWGTDRIDGAEGNEKAAFSTGMSEGKPQLGFATGDGTVVEFLFPADEQAIDVAKISVWVDGVVVSSGTTEAVTGVTWTVAPVDGAKIVIKWEY